MDTIEATYYPCQFCNASDGYTDKCKEFCDYAITCEDLKNLKEYVEYREELISEP